jgi:hypothetical protein
MSTLLNVVGAKDPGEFCGIVGNSRALRSVLDEAGIVAPTDSTVLIEGETGTWQRTDRACDPHVELSREGSIRYAELRSRSRQSAGKRAFWPRARGVHRSGYPKARSIRNRQRWHLVSRRDRRTRP